MLVDNEILLYHKGFLSQDLLSEFYRLRCPLSCSFSFFTRSISLFSRLIC